MKLKVRNMDFEALVKDLPYFFASTFTLNQEISHIYDIHVNSIIEQKDQENVKGRE